MFGEDEAEQEQEQDRLDPSLVFSSVELDVMCTFHGKRDQACCVAERAAEQVAQAQADEFFRRLR